MFNYSRACLARTKPTGYKRQIEAALRGKRGPERGDRGAGTVVRDPVPSNPLEAVGRSAAR
jgi:hypothetical protein